MPLRFPRPAVHASVTMWTCLGALSAIVPQGPRLRIGSSPIQTYAAYKPGPQMVRRSTALDLKLHDFKSGGLPLCLCRQAEILNDAAMHHRLWAGPIYVAEVVALYNPDSILALPCLGFLV